MARETDRDEAHNFRKALKRPSRDAVKFVGMLAVAAIVTAGAWAAPIVWVSGPERYSFPPDLGVRTSAMVLRRAAETWRGAQGSDACPTPQAVIAGGALDPAAQVVDPWGTPFVIACTDDETTVTSFGPDRLPGTSDDIQIPNKAK